MTSDEYEIVIGKLMIVKLYMTKNHRDNIDAVIEALENEYLRNLPGAKI